MTDYKKYINALRKCANEHENNKTSTGHIIVSNLCRDTAILLEEIEQESRWIPVSERLPEENGVYFVSYEDSVSLLEWFNGKWFFYPSNPAREETGTIIAWMSLPEPYKVESEGKG